MSGNGLPTTWGQFQQRFMSSFYAARSWKRFVLTLITWWSFCAFGICMCRSFKKTCWWNRPLEPILPNFAFLCSPISYNNKVKKFGRIYFSLEKWESIKKLKPKNVLKSIFRGIFVFFLKCEDFASYDSLISRHCQTSKREMLSFQLKNEREMSVGWKKYFCQIKIFLKLGIDR